MPVPGLLQGLSSVSGAVGLGYIASQAMSGWQGVAASKFVTSEASEQKMALEKVQSESMQKQALIRLVTDMIEGACKMIKGCGEAIKGLC